MRRPETQMDFETVIFPHLPAAYNLARWLLRDTHDAEDAVQSACLRAFKSFEQFSVVGSSEKQAAAWLLTIVRNTCLTALQKRTKHGTVIHLDTVRSTSSVHLNEALSDSRDTPESMLEKQDKLDYIRQAIDHLQLEFREVLVLREFGDKSYREIADITGLPLGTVMSRLSRARAQLRQSLRSIQPEAQLP